MNKKIQIRDINDVDSNLTWFSKLKINHRYKKVASRTKLQEAKTKENDLEIENTRNENKKKVSELQDNLKEQRTKINIKIQETKGRLEVKQTEGKCDRVEAIETKGRWLKGFNIFLVITSCLTSMLGFGMIESGLDLFPLFNSLYHLQNLNCIAIGIIFLIVQFCVSMFVSSVDNIRKFFNNWINKVLLILVAVVYAVSIYSNYGFWITLTSSQFVACFYSFIIDAFGVMTSYYSDKFINLDSEKIYEFLAEKPVEDVVKNTKKTEEKNVGKNVATSDKINDSYVNENGENDTEKRKRKSVGKSKMTQEEFDLIVAEEDEGKKLAPKMFGLTNEKDKYYKLCEDSPVVEKIGSYYYKKVEDKSFEVVSQ